jgi:hypothetical protein
MQTIARHGANSWSKGAIDNGQACPRSFGSWLARRGGCSNGQAHRTYQVR